MEAQQQWFYVDASGQQAGPITADVLQASVGNGSISPETLVWTEGMADWLPAQSIEGMVTAAPVVAAPHQPQINLGPSLTQPSQVNPYSSPQANLGLGTGVSPKLSMGAILFGFQGRIPRRVYWGYLLVTVTVFYALLFGMIAAFGPESNVTIVGLFLLYIPMGWMGLALQIKRWHDRGKSGWHWLIGLIPFIGGIWVFIECGCLRGDFGANLYGEDPT